MQPQEHRHFWHNPELKVNALYAYHRNFAYPRHSHDEYVICLVERGLQSFTHKGTKYITPPSGLILINPSIVHTGEPASEVGFRMSSLYPAMEHMAWAMQQLVGNQRGVPYFREVRVDDVAVTQRVRALHEALYDEAEPLECESRFLAVLVELIQRYGEIRPNTTPLGDERRVVRRARDYLESCYAERISLSDLAAEVGLSPYHLLRVFQTEVGLTPHAYLQDVRVRRACELMLTALPLAEIAVAVGFSHQSHLTRRFKQIVGLTPGQFVSQMRGEIGR